MTSIINSIWWERTYLVVELSEKTTHTPTLVSVDGNTICNFALDEENSSGCLYKLNIAIAGGRSLLDTGDWILCASAGAEPMEISEEVLLGIEDCNRSFFYGPNGSRLYSVRFLVESKNETPYLRIRIGYYRSDKHPKRDISLGSFVKAAANCLYHLMLLFHPKRGNKVLFMSENNTELIGNMAAIDARMKERGLTQEYKLDYSLRNIFGRKKSIGEWLRVLNAIASHDYIFVEDYVPIFAALHLSNKTKLIQVWHAGFGFKAVGFGRFGIQGSPNPFNSCHRKYTYALVGNEYLREIYSEVFGIEREALLATGMPRLDGFLDERKIKSAQQKFYNEFPQAKGKRIILFAPTYRGQSQNEAYYDFGKVDFGALCTLCEKTNSLILFKMHRFISERVRFPESSERCFINISDWNINDAFYVTDILVTDYSSCFYDFLLLEKPTVFYCYDEPYYAATRGIHRPVGDIAPGNICRNFDELVNELYKTELQRPTEVDRRLIDRCAEGSGRASDRVIDAIFFEELAEGVCLR